MAATITVTPPQSQHDTARPIRKYTLVWLCHTDGSGTLPTGHLLNGEIVGITFTPDSANAPTSLYDMTITDGSGIDVAAGLGANLSATASLRIVPMQTQTISAVVYRGAYVVAEEQLTLNITNTGTSKGGTVLIYLR